MRAYQICVESEIWQVEVVFADLIFLNIVIMLRTSFGTLNFNHHRSCPRSRVLPIYFYLFRTVNDSELLASANLFVRFSAIFCFPHFSMFVSIHLLFAYSYSSLSFCFVHVFAKHEYARFLNTLLRPFLLRAFTDRHHYGTTVRACW